MRPRIIATAEGTRQDAFGPVEWGLLAGIALMWGSSFLWIAEGVESFSPAVVALSRLVLGAAALALFPATRHPVERSDWPAIALLGVVWMSVPLLLFPIAQQWVDSAIAGMINGGVPLFAAVVAAVLLRRLPGPVQVAGLLVGFGGVILITLPAASQSGGSPLGVSLILGATALYGLAFNMSVPLAQKYGSLPVLLRAQLVAMGLVAPFGLVGLSSSSWAWSSAGAMVLLGVFSTGVAYVAMTELGRRVGATRGSIAIYFLPIVALVLGVVFRDEAVPGLAVAGTAFVIVGAWLSSRREQRPI
jgi:drug/metabolite transporter (DMT)-like permease